MMRSILLAQTLVGREVILKMKKNAFSCVQFKWGKCSESKNCESKFTEQKAKTAYQSFNCSVLFYFYSESTSSIYKYKEQEFQNKHVKLILKKVCAELFKSNLGGNHLNDHLTDWKCGC